MTELLLNYAEVNPKNSPLASVIWMHGLGANGYDFADIVPSLQLPDSLAVRFIFPHAPKRPVTINNGYVMPAWYDIESTDLQQKEDEEGIRHSQAAICRLIENERQLGVSANRIVLVGFSQGGALALHTGLRYADSLAGILALSCYLPLAYSLNKEASRSNLSIPIMMAHGTVDSVVPLQAGELSMQYLKKIGYKIELHTYNMQHTVCLEEIADISKWLLKILRVD